MDELNNPGMSLHTQHTGELAILGDLADQSFPTAVASLSNPDVGRKAKLDAATWPGLVCSAQTDTT